MKKFFAIACAILVAPLFAHAQGAELFLTSYQSVIDLPSISSEIPIVAEVPLPASVVGQRVFTLYDKTEQFFEPFYLLRETEDLLPQSIRIAGVLQPELTDDDIDSSIDFELVDDLPSTAVITISTPQPISASALTLALARHVSLPTHITIVALVDGVERTIVSQRELSNTRVVFPETTSDSWTVTLRYSQLLRISEIALDQRYEGDARYAIRFLAQPSHEYAIYANPDHYERPPVGEAGNLARAETVTRLENIAVAINPLYEPTDLDVDGVADLSDNCVNISNPDQIDLDGNGRGDACDDFDLDGKINSRDNCPNKPNRDQLDTDADGLGDVCDDEESRITERLTWLPWAGLGVAVVILLALLAATIPSHRKM